MPLKGIIFEKIKNFIKDNSDLENKSESEQFQIFSLFHLLKGYELDMEDIFLGIVEGGDDYGIDAIYSLIDGHIINSPEDIIQFLNNLLLFLEHKALNLDLHQFLLLYPL